MVKNESLTASPPSKLEIEGLIDRSGRSRLLAAKGANAGGGEKCVQTPRDQRDGTLAGFYSRSIRGIVARALPVPITFKVRRDCLDRGWPGSGAELIDALREQRPGH